MLAVPFCPFLSFSVPFWPFPARPAWVVPAGTLGSGRSRAGHGAILKSWRVGLGSSRSLAPGSFPAFLAEEGEGGDGSPWDLAQSPQTSSW